MSEQEQTEWLASGSLPGQAVELPPVVVPGAETTR